MASGPLKDWKQWGKIWILAIVLIQSAVTTQNVPHANKSPMHSSLVAESHQAPSDVTWKSLRSTDSNCALPLSLFQHFAGDGTFLFGGRCFARPQHIIMLGCVTEEASGAALLRADQKFHLAITRERRNGERMTLYRHNWLTGDEHVLSHRRQDSRSWCE